MSVFVVFGAYVNADGFPSLAYAGRPPMPSTLTGKEIPLNARRSSLICSSRQDLSLQVTCIKPGRFIVRDNVFFRYSVDKS